MKITDVERWWMGDLCNAQSWLNKEELEDVADQVDVQVVTLRKYIETAREFPEADRDPEIPWGAYQKLCSVVAAKDRQRILETSDGAPWTAATMDVKVREHLRRVKAEKTNKKRLDQGLDPLPPQAKAGVYRAEKTGCNIFGIPLHVEYNKKVRSVEMVLDIALENVIMDTLGGKTRVVGVLPLADVEDEDLDDEE
jgi:hypothetical protein